MNIHEPRMNKETTLIRSLSSKNPRTRAMAAWLLAELETSVFGRKLVNRDKAGAALIRNLKHANAEVRGSAAFALGCLEYTESVPALQVAAGDSDFEVRRDVVLALGEIGDKRAFDTLKAIVRGDIWTARSLSREAAGAAHRCLDAVDIRRLESVIAHPRTSPLERKALSAIVNAPTW